MAWSCLIKTHNLTLWIAKQEKYMPLDSWKLADVQDLVE
jgi:hypothetical protein